MLFERRIGDLLFSTEVVEIKKTDVRTIVKELKNYAGINYVKYYALCFLLAVVGMRLYQIISFGLIANVILKNIDSISCHPHPSDIPTII